MKNNQSGRSMIEMLCVLTLVGVLTLGGVAGYNAMITKYKANKIAQHIAILVTEIKAAYAQQSTYDGISNQTLISMGLLNKEFGTNPSAIRIPEGGTLNVFPSDLRDITDATVDAAANKNAAVVIEVGNLSQPACQQLALADWGSQTNAGLVAFVCAAKTQTSTTGVLQPTTYAGGAKNNLGAKFIYLNDQNDYTQYRADSEKGKYGFAIPGNKKAPIPMMPATYAKGCSCKDPDSGVDLRTCSFAIKIY